MLSYSGCRDGNISLKSRPFFTGMGIISCLLVLITVQQTVQWRSCATVSRTC
ncbi:heat-shock protein [Escherichia coli]|nr:heat-shock protein [Escherichia coli]KAA1932470.1 heat-shock protein [Escherichia coli]KAA1977886.1 heat-shock protein [Escherichia coli]KAA2182063.1 heat-shock protein [Escherichia coli]